MKEEQQRGQEKKKEKKTSQQMRPFRFSLLKQKVIAGLACFSHLVSHSHCLSGGCWLPVGEGKKKTTTTKYTEL